MNRLALIATPAGTAVVAVSALLRWVTVDYQDALRGSVSISATGRELVPALLPLAGAALAALGAMLATKGLLRRVVGALTVALGVAVILLSVVGLKDGPAELLPAAAALDTMTVHRSLLGVLLAVLGGVLWCAAGAVQAVAGRSGGLGTRYERRPTGPVDDETRLWRELDAHRDPTVDSGGDGDHSPAV